MPKLQRNIEMLEKELADPDLYARNAARFDEASREMETMRDTLDASEMEWLELEEKKEALQN